MVPSETQKGQRLRRQRATPSVKLPAEERHTKCPTIVFGTSIAIHDELEHATRVLVL